MRCMGTSNKHYLLDSLDFFPGFSQFKTVIFFDPEGAYSLDKNINNIRRILITDTWYIVRVLGSILMIKSKTWGWE